MHPDYLIFLSIKVILLLLGPHIAHIILVVLETHLCNGKMIKKYIYYVTLAG